MTNPSPLPETAPAGLGLLAALDAAEPALAAVDPDAWASDVQRRADDLARTVPRTETVSRETLEARASARLSEAHATMREQAFDALIGTINSTLSDADRRLQAEAESRRSVRVPVADLTVDEQAALDREAHASALLGPVARFVAAQIVESRRGNALTGELLAVLTLDASTATGELLDAMEHDASPYRAARAESLLRARLGALRVEAATAETEDARNSAREALRRFADIREARVSPEARQAEAAEQAAWRRLSAHAQQVRSRVAVWRAAGVPHDQGAPVDTLSRWREERDALRSMFGGGAK